MKRIENNPGGEGAWRSTLAEDLEFIKKHKRYKMSKKTLPSALLFVLFVVSSAYMLRAGIVAGYEGNSLLSVVLILLLSVSLLSAIARYIYSLRFRLITTPFSKERNIELLIAFLRGRQINVYRHPTIPEVVQIISRPLGNKPEQREVMVFIADEHRILMNAHYAGMKWVMSSSSSAGKMAKELAAMIAAHVPDPNTGRDRQID